MLNRYLNILILILIAACCINAQSANKLRKISITTEPKTQIFVNGVIYGRTDDSGKIALNVPNLPRLQLTAKADGFKQHEQALLRTGPATVKLTLTKTTDKAELAFQDAERKLKVDRREAIEAYKATLELKPAYPEVLIALARALIEIGEFTEAEDALAKARKLRPGFAEASAVQGRLYKDEGDTEKAIASFQQAIKEGRGFQPEAFTGLALLYSDKAETAVDDPSINDEELFTLAEINFVSAIDQLAGAPDAAVVYQLLGRTYEKRNKVDEAINLYKTFLNLFPDSVEATAVRSFITQLEKQKAPVNY